TGEWSYAVDPSKIQFLNENERVTDTLQVKSEDGTATQDIVVTITGTNDKPVISGDTSGKVIEAGGAGNTDAGVATASGTLTIRDVDHDESHFKAPSSP
ncbi:VCBS domain-containing protein, partial [Chitinimonas sp. PSY-7]|uniref:VCBS domain-containing protein n=1 Tax=Chitinimonas sp. PSY-7 TaxID=3459088 RepID=UPI0040401EC8